MISNIYFYKIFEVVLSLRLLYFLELLKSREKNIKLRFLFFLKINVKGITNFPTKKFTSDATTNVINHTLKR